MKFEDEPYALKLEAERRRRAQLLCQAHMKPLVEYLQRVQEAHPENELPCFDPYDGGIGSRVLMLLEAPGPKAVGSTFISRNNPDPTARNMCELLQAAEISRQDTILWNIVPWYVGQAGRIRPVKGHDIRKALPHLGELIELLPKLQVIVLWGKKAQSAQEHLKRLTDLPILCAPHPSARVFNVWPQKRAEAQQTLIEVAQRLNNCGR